MKASWRWWGAGAAAAVGTALACGPEFPLMLTTCRDTCLEQISGFPLFSELQRLGKEAQPRDAGARATPSSRERTDAFEQNELAPAAAAAVAAMRAAATGDGAYAVGQGLPEDVRLYTAGAVDFNRMFPTGVPRELFDTSTPRPLRAEDVPALSRAIERFEAVTALPQGERVARGVWATFMLGRAYYARNNAGDVERAGDAFRRTVSLVRGGAQDPLGLANAALGELGWLEREQDRVADAVGFYLEQQSEGSLWWMAETMYGAPERMDEWLGDPRTQRLLVVYLGVRADTTCRTDCPNSFAGTPYQISARTRAVIEAAVPRVAALPAADVEMADRWAGLAYAVGAYDAADALAARSATGYAQWIKAKLALHRGDIPAAEAAFAAASRSFPAERRAVREARPYPLWIAPLYQRLVGEQALLTLSRGDYVEALSQLVASSAYTRDIDYVAERVLTVDELKAFVDRAGAVRPALPPVPWGRVRDLLARRLARDGRYAEAVDYYLSPATRARAARYVGARAAAEQGATAAARARGWYEVAELEVVHGMALRGAAGYPDWYPGSYRMDRSPEPPAVEASRVEASAVAPARRFHYREVGVEHLMMSADLLPPKSPEFSAVLCNGAAWLFGPRSVENRDLIDRVYLRYVREGRAEPWADRFGRECPEPRFE